MTRTLLLHGVPIHVRHGLPPVEAVGVHDGRVVATGTYGQVEQALPPGAEVRRLSSGAVLPAFIDPHQHACLVAADPGTDVLHGRARDIAGLLRALEGLIAAEELAPRAGSWLRFHGYAPFDFAERRSPTASELDRVALDRPLHVLSRTYHESAVNSAGLDALGIGRGTPDPPGGRIVRDRRGRPTGVLLEAASFAVEAVSRREDPGDWLERLAAHGRLLASLGITRIGDAAVPVEVADAMVAQLENVGIAAHPLLIGSRIDEPAIRGGGTAKVLADGGEYCHLCFTGRQVALLGMATVRASVGPERSLAAAVGRRAGSVRRAKDGRWHSGISYAHESGLGRLLREAADAGSGLAVHAIGNGAVDAVLRAAESDPALAAAVPLRVEHAMAVDVDLARRLGGAGIPVVVQPAFLPAFGHELALMPLPDPLRLMPFRTLMSAGVTVAFSSDYPAAGLSPWTGIAAAVHRRDRTGRPIHPDEAIDLAAALDASTRGAASVLGVADAGTLEPGMRADMVWCDRDPYAVPTEELAGIVTFATWSGGRQVHGQEPAPTRP